MKISKKIAALAFLFVFGASTFTSAATYISKTLTGTNAESGYVYLGNGTRTLNGTGKAGAGTLYAKKIVKLLPDSTVASVGIKYPNAASATFTASGANNSGIVQSYYIKWSGDTASSEVSASLTD